MKSLVARIWRGVKSTGTLQVEEYRASVQALNIFFGAIIGVSFGQIGDIDIPNYMLLLFVTSATVTVILIVSNTRRFVYSSLLLIAVLGSVWYGIYRGAVFTDVPRLLFPTLLVWSAMALLTEFTPREKDAAADADIVES
ncbi:MAG: hypothetical protein WA979_08550 [Pacificimonas sp.]